jgi:hypothetical protein
MAMGVFFGYNFLLKLLMAELNNTSVWGLIGLALGAYVHIVVGLMLLITSLPNFAYSGRLVLFLFTCYRLLDYGILTLCFRSFLLLLEVCKKLRNIMYSIVGRIFITFFDLLDAAFNQLSRLLWSLFKSFHSNLIVPLLRNLNRLILLIWENPYAGLVTAGFLICFAYFINQNKSIMIATTAMTTTSLITMISQLFTAVKNSFNFLSQIKIIQKSARALVAFVSFSEKYFRSEMDTLVEFVHHHSLWDLSRYSRPSSF